MTTPPTAESDLGWALGAVMRSYLRAAHDAVGAVPGGPRGYQVLSMAFRGEQRSQLALAQHLGVDRTVMTYLLDDLESAGLVERRPDPADRRARRIVLTDAGTEKLCDLERRLRAAEDELLDPLDPAEQEVLRGLLDRVATRTATATDNPCAVAQEMQDELAAPAVTPRRRR
ncbi:MarR family winged helix-turn-helix transcriptional regulator [Pseudonocardia xinjiangensis]|nr:MarR family transcriptional regulator [Pseudonocardia xinjiangensis]